jgi:hypothetical protein
VTENPGKRHISSAELEIRLTDSRQTNIEEPFARGGSRVRQRVEKLDSLATCDNSAHLNLPTLPDRQTRPFSRRNFMPSHTFILA